MIKNRLSGFVKLFHVAAVLCYGLWKLMKL